MAARQQLPGMQWFLWMSNVALRIGILTGIYLSCTLLAWIWAANRLHQLEAFAGVRNLAAAVLMFVLMSIPVFRFHNEPAKMFVSGLTAWTLLTLTYIGAELRYSLLETRMGALHAFTLGVVTYGLVAVFHWVFLICAEARHRHIVQTQRLTAPHSRHRGH